MTCLHSSLLLTLAAATASVAPAQTDPTQTVGTRLVHHLVPGEEFSYSIQLDSTVSLTDEKQNSSMKVVLHFDAKITTPDAAGKNRGTVLHRLTRMQASTQSADATTEFDSALPLEESNIPGPAAVFVGQTLTTQVGSNGKIYHTELAKEFLRKHKDELRGDDFDSLIQLYFVALPDKPVVLGATWESHTRLADTGLATGRSATVIHRFEKLEENRAHISHSFQLPNPQRKDVAFKLKEARGQTILDQVSGRVLETRVLLLAEARKEVTEGEALTGTSKLEITLLADKPADSKAVR
ncbi:MAG: hypothetical protein VYE77_12050 [Planctomycetota bacterium]|nr:hypothetical protein [Planctomycetota bacterium]